MDKHSRAVGGPGKGKRRRLSTLKESEALERKFFRMNWSSWQRMPYGTVTLPSPHSLPRFIPT